MATTNTRKVILIRTGIVFAFMVIFAVAIVANIVNLKFFKQADLAAKAEKMLTQVVAIQPERGCIFDCNGMLLATSLPIYDIRLDGRAVGFDSTEIFYKHLDSLAYYLHYLFKKDKSIEQYKNLLIGVRKSRNMYFLFKSNISYMEMRQMLTFPIFRMGKYKGGIHVEEKFRRIKPFNMLAERTIGFYRKGVASVGLEGSYNNYLRGKSGKQVKVLIGPKTFIPIDSDISEDAENGKDIVCTIDVRLQDVAENSLMRELKNNNAESGTAILMEVKTGHIKAIANLTQTKDGNYTENLNYAVGHAIEPGSTFKLISVLALLEEGTTKSQTMVNPEGGVKTFCNAVMEDSHPIMHNITMQQAFEISSNVGIAKQVNKIFAAKPNALYKIHKQLGLTDITGININGEAKPKIKSPDDRDWSCTSLPWMSIGYELLVTPLHVLTIYNAIANNGVMVKPMLVKQILSNGLPVETFNTEVINDKICNQNTVLQLRKMMEGVVINGTAKNYKTTDYNFAGKTGTALIAGKGGYKGLGGKSYRASFCGYFPAENPLYSCYVLISKPRSGKIYGSELALPVFKDIADKVFALQLKMHKDLRYAQHHATNNLPDVKKALTQDLKNIYNNLGISHHLHTDSIKEEEGIWAQASIQDYAIAISPLLHASGKTPDVLGMSAKDAVFLLESKGYKVSIYGKGKVVSQSVKVGSTILKGSTIKLQLS